MTKFRGARLDTPQPLPIQRSLGYRLRYFV